MGVLWEGYAPLTRNPLIWCASVLCLVLAACAVVLTKAGTAAIGRWGVAGTVLADSVRLTLDGDPNSGTSEGMMPLRDVLFGRIGQMQATVDALPDKVLAPVNAAVAHANTRIEQAVTAADTRIGGALATVDEAVKVADKRLASIQDDARPVLVNAAAAAESAGAVANDAHGWLVSDEFAGVVNGAAVVTTQVAQTAEYARQVAPEFLATGQRTNEQVAGIVTDVHAFTTKFTAPQTKKQKAWEGFRAMALIGVRFL